jgi:hypothetical protein
MGLWEFLTKQRGLGSTAFRWSEPPMYRIRLRGDLAVRAGIVLAAWGLAIGVLLVLFAFNVRPPGMSLALGLGAVFGLGPGMLILFWSNRQAGGSITIDNDMIRRHRQYASLTMTGMWGEWADWPYEAIDRCVIVPAQALDQSFAVMLLSIDSEWEIVGIPERIELQKLAKFLAGRGVKVSQGKSVPASFLSRIPLPVAGVAAAAGVIILAAGIGTYVSKVGGPQLARGDRNAREPADIPQPGFNPDDLVNINDIDSLPRGPVAPPVSSPFGIPGTAAPAITDHGVTTELLGGAGGTLFRFTSPTGEPVLGIRYTIGTWAGKQRVGRVQPVFQRDDTDGPDVLMARDGYAVGGLEVDASEFVDALALVCVRLTPAGGVDPADSYTSDWIGEPSGRPPRTLTGNGRKVIGIYGRGAAILDAVGLILEP